MPQHLKSRQMQVPGGFRYRQPEINWDSNKVLGLHPSFSTLVAALISARKANPHHAAKHKWSTDPEVVGNEVEAFQVRICQSMGWSRFLTEEANDGPFTSHPSIDPSQLNAAAGAIKKLWTGIKTLNDFLDSGEPHVAAELAEARATVCISCPSNGQGDWSKWFVKPAAAAVKRQLEKLQERKISTSKDDQIQICQVCLCPLKLKVQTPLKYIKPHMPDGMLHDLRAANENCWIVKEVEASA